MLFNTHFKYLIHMAIILVCTASAQATANRAPSADEVSDTRPNIVLFMIDTLRADRLGVYGYDKPTSPHIDALAEESVLFTRADAAAPWTLPSIISMMTSRHPAEHGVVVEGPRIPEDQPVLAEQLMALGYDTVSYYANEYAGRSSGMTRGFDQAELVRYTDKEKVEEYLDSRTGTDPFFLYIHNVEPHNPFDLQVSQDYLEPFGEVGFPDRLRMLELYSKFRAATRAKQQEGKDTTAEQAAMLEELQAMKDATIDPLYDASVRLADARAGEVIQALRDAGEWDNTLFILLSDHGEEMGEHDGWQHDQSVYPELVHVPFLIRFPGGAFAGQQRPEPVTLVDLIPTVLDWLGAPEPADGYSGVSLLPAITGGDDSGERLVDMGRFTAQRINLKKYYRPFKEQRGDINIVFHEGPWKAIWNVEPNTIELYHVPDDPDNMNNVAGDHPERVTRFRAAFEEHFGPLHLEQFRHTNDEWELSPEQEENLKTLGYL